MTSVPTVYVSNRASTHDYTSASKMGALRFVTIGNYPIFKTARLQEEIITALAYSTKDDYLLFSTFESLKFEALERALNARYEGLVFQKRDAHHSLSQP